MTLTFLSEHHSVALKPEHGSGILPKGLSEATLLDPFLESVSQVWAGVSGRTKEFA